MGSADSLSFPSEPPDVGNWFSSYAYDSPALNSADDFEDLRCSIEEETGDENKGKTKDFPEFCASRKRDALLDNEKGAATRALICKSLSVGGHVNWTNEVSENADCLSQISEPLDVRNWFSSYCYVSPALDTWCESRLEPIELGVDDKENHAPTSVIPEKEESRNIKRAVELHHLRVLNNSSDGLKKHTYDFGEECCQNQFAKDSHKDCRSKNLSLRTLDKRQCKDNGCDITKEVEQSVNSGVSHPAYFDAKVETDASPLLLGNTGAPESEEHILVRKPFRSREPTNEVTENEAFVEGMGFISPAGEMKLKMGKKRPLNKAAGGDEETENHGIKYAESGFISIRKNRPAEDENSFRKSLKDNVALPPKGNKDATAARKVLSEITNFQAPQPQVLGITGKWKCPQKSKPYLGPPLKQLRLEQWVRRV